MTADTTINVDALIHGRFAEVARAYDAYRAAVGARCSFCGVADNEPAFVEKTTASMLVVINRFPYAIWDRTIVEDHLMIVPVRHVLSLDEYTGQEMADWFALARTYEADGYSLYSRAPSNGSRSVGHVHTHLIKTGAHVA